MYILALVAVTLFTACSETNDESSEYDNWQERNDAYFSSVYAKAQSAIKAGDSNWKIIRCFSKPQSTTTVTDYIVAEVIENGAGTVTPLYTDSVSVHYRGSLMPTQQHPDGYQFDSSWTGDYNLNLMRPYTRQVNGFVDGFSTALSAMKEGDRWVVYIPYVLGYNAIGESSIPAYSTLVFDITMAKVMRKK